VVEENQTVLLRQERKNPRPHFLVRAKTVGEHQNLAVRGPKTVTLCRSTIDAVMGTLTFPVLTG
jgi:hypothetical protein